MVGHHRVRLEKLETENQMFLATNQELHVKLQDLEGKAQELL